MLLLEQKGYGGEDLVLTLEDWKRADLIATAVNPIAVANSYGDVVRRLHDEAHARGKGFAWVAKHPINLLWVDKIAHLSGTQNIGQPDIMDAYRMVREKLNLSMLKDIQDSNLSKLSRRYRVYVGKLYRSRTFFIPDGTAGDIVRHEQELGNDLKVDGDTLALLDTFGADHIIWATFNRNAATRYGDEVIELPLGPVVDLGDDGDHGHLVLSRSPISKHLR